MLQKKEKLLIFFFNEAGVTIKLFNSRYKEN